MSDELPNSTNSNSSPSSVMSDHVSSSIDELFDNGHQKSNYFNQQFEQDNKSSGASSLFSTGNGI